VAGVRCQKTDDRKQKSVRKEGEKIRRWEGERRNDIIIEVSIHYPAPTIDILLQQDLKPLSRFTPPNFVLPAVRHALCLFFHILNSGFAVPSTIYPLLCAVRRLPYAEN